MLPELERERGILLGILAHVHGGQFPELLLGVNAEVRGGFFQALFTLDFLEVVKAQAVQSVAESILVQHWRGQHGVVDRTVYREAGRP